MGAQIKPCEGFKPSQGFSFLDEFLAGLRFKQRKKLEELPIGNYCRGYANWLNG